MNTTSKNRSPACDIIRIFAFLSVISVHFFMNSGFYSVPIDGARLYLMTVARCFFMVCVPLFLILTGYLMCNKKLEKGYYGRITKTLFVYVCASILCILFKKYYLMQEWGLQDTIEGTLGFTGASYSWYIEMYIGLFLIIPFLNGAYHSLESKKQKIILVGTMLCLTALPSVLNIFVFDSFAFWAEPIREWEYTKIVPSFFTILYPVTYYYLGCFIREFKPKPNKALNALFIIVLAFAFGSFNYYRSRGSIFVSGIWQEWGALPNVIMTVLVFIFLLNLPSERLPSPVKKTLSYISDLTLGGYLLSYIFDQYFYGKLNAKVDVVTDRIVYFVPMVAVVAISSLLLSLAVNLLYKAMCAILKSKRKTEQ
ncbi:MAG: hypothetical protein E7656_08200 [Ruminococcaceae bacterium]|nr:hypothetical protein [Oscillospiraceae bacterium]